MEKKHELEYGSMKSKGDILILSNITLGQKAKFVRLSKGLRQIDLASLAKVNPLDITRLEHDRYVLPTRRKRILAVLGLLEKDNESD
jgi:hypothetical protein